MKQNTPAYKVVDAERWDLVENVCRDPGMEIDSLNEHPEYRRLEAEHEQGLHGLAEPGGALVPHRVRDARLLDVGRIIH